jgi:hypothetical protein
MLDIMSTFITFLTWVMLAVICSTTHTTLQPQEVEIPLPPSQDPFYTAPVGYEDNEPGTILRIRLAPGNLSTITGNCSTIHNIVYRTTDSRYEPSWAVTTLFTPSSPSGNGGGSALLSYQIPYNSADVDASPSYSLYSDTGRPPDIAAALGRGWYVNVPDFEGPLASFALGVQEGHATLDSVRAVLHSRFALSKDVRYAMWGYSGGSIASEWAAELQVQYAPELNFAGVALGGLVPNLTNSVETITGTMWAGLIPPGLLGVTSQNQEALDFLLSKFKKSGPYNQTEFLSAYHMNLTQALVTFAGQNIFDYLEGGITTFNSPIIQEILNSNGLMGYHGVPEMPMFFYKAIADEIAPIKDTDELVQRYCDVGVSILYQRNEIGGHVAEETNGDARAFEWLSGVLESTSGLKNPSVGCIIEDVAVNVTDSPL